jgi:hypothetical protein
MLADGRLVNDIARPTRAAVSEALESLAGAR